MLRIEVEYIVAQKVQWYHVIAERHFPSLVSRVSAENFDLYKRVLVFEAAAA